MFPTQAQSLPLDFFYVCIISECILYGFRIALFHINDNNKQIGVISRVCYSDVYKFLI